MSLPFESLPLFELLTVVVVVTIVREILTVLTTVLLSALRGACLYESLNGHRTYETYQYTSKSEIEIYLLTLETLLLPHPFAIIFLSCKSRLYKGSHY